MRDVFRIAVAAVALILLSAPLSAEESSIAPGDTLRITVLGEQDLSRQAVVDVSGNITLPLVGEIKVGGLAPSQAAESLRQALSRFVKRPDVTVELAVPARKGVIVSGAVRTPGAYQLESGARLMDAIASAGGALTLADLSKVSITCGREKTTKTFNLADYKETADQALNPSLEAGDVITVPELIPISGEVFLTGEVVQRGAMPLREGMTLRDAIGAAGGLTQNADPANATIKRAGQQTASPLDVASVMQGNPSSDIELKSGDWIYVPALQQLGTFSVLGEVNHPGTFPLRGSVLLTDAIAQAGGLTQRAKASVRITGTGKPPTMIDIGKVTVGAAQNVAISAGDTLFVERRRQAIDPFRAIGAGVSILWAIIRAGR